MNAITSLYDRIVQILSGAVFESIALLGIRIALAGVFWRSYKTKIAEGTWFTPNDSLPFLFQDLYAGLPLPDRHRNTVDDLFRVLLPGSAVRRSLHPVWCSSAGSYGTCDPDLYLPNGRALLGLGAWHHCYGCHPHQPRRRNVCP